MRKSLSRPDRSALETQALLAARSLVDRMRSLYRELEQLTGAPITLHRALLCIGEEPGISSSDLALRIGMKRPAVSQLLKNLATRGWIERRRRASDQRSVRIHPTAEGRKILNLTAGRAVGVLKRAVNGLAPQDLRCLATGLEALLNHLPPAAPASSANGKLRTTRIAGSVSGHTARPENR